MKRSQRAISMVTALAGLLIGTALVNPVDAAPVTVSCGQTITQNTTLAGDVGPCPGNGIVIGANGITLDLNRHAVLGDQSDEIGPGAQSESAGILLDNVRGVTVKNGGVRFFEAGVVIDRGSRNAVTGVAADSNVSHCQGEVMTQLPGEFGDGILVRSSTRNVIENNTSTRNGPFSGIGLLTDNDFGKPTGPEVDGNTIRGNRVNQNFTCFGEIGIRVEGPGASGNIVGPNNEVSRSFLEGIAVLPVLNTDFSGFGTTCGPVGPPGPDGQPTNVNCPPNATPNPPNRDNLIRDNHVFENALGQARSGINMLAFTGFLGANGQFSIVNPQFNTVRNNRSEGNGGDGIANSGGVIGFNATTGACNPSGCIARGGTNNSFLNNTSVNNNQDGCPAVGRCGERFDLFDGYGVRRTTPTATAPATTTVVAGPPCDSNTWFGNTYGTAFPECTTAGGTQVGTGAASSSLAAPVPASSPGISPPDETLATLPPSSGRAFVGVP